LRDFVLVSLRVTLREEPMRYQSVANDYGKVVVFFLIGDRVCCENGSKLFEHRALNFTRALRNAVVGKLWSALGCKGRRCPCEIVGRKLIARLASWRSNLPISAPPKPSSKEFDHRKDPFPGKVEDSFSTTRMA
jgi:hypothetical protein